MPQQTISGQFPVGSVANPTGTLSQALSLEGPTSDDPALGGTLAWAVHLLNATAAVGNNANVTTHGLIMSGYGFTIPTAATIVGVAATLTTYQAGAGNLSGTQISWKLTAGGNNKGGQTINQISGVPGTYTFNVGGPADTWGNTLTPAIVNAAGFGMEVQWTITGTASGTQLGIQGPYTITVYYILPGVSNVILADASSVNFVTPAWTQGAALLYTVPSQPGLTTPWNIASLSIAFQGFLNAPNLNTRQYGKLGDLRAGMLFNVGPVPNQGANPWTNPMPQFPSESSLISKIWDGANDAPFPQVNATAAVQPARFLTTTAQLSIEQSMQPGEQATIGLWLTPSLAQNCQILIANATYSIVYSTAT